MDHDTNRAEKWCNISHTRTLFFNADENQNLAYINNASKRYNTLSVLNANTDIVNNLSPKEIAEQLAVAKERCQNEFGIFTEKDLH